MALVPLRRIALVFGLACGVSSVARAQVGSTPATRPLLPAAPAVTPATAPVLKPGVAPATLPATRPATRPVATRPGPEPLPAMIDLQLMFEQAKYADLLKQLQRVLVLRGKAAEPYDRWTLMMLKFETNMRMKAQAPAIATLRDAQEMTDDEKKLNWCKAVELLIKRSKNFAYQPMPMKKEKPPTIDIIDPDRRKDALQALLLDELAVVKPKVEKALDGQKLAGIAEALAALQGFDVLESAAGSAEESQRMITDLRTRGIALMGKSIQRIQTEQETIDRQANQLLQRVVDVPRLGGGFDRVTRTYKRGLEGQDYTELKAMSKEADLLIVNLKGLAKATGGQVREVEDLVSNAQDLKKKIERTMTANYSTF